MRRTSLLTLAAAVLLILKGAHVSALAQDPVGTIRGSVLRGTTADGVPMAEVTLRMTTAGAPPVQRKVTADSAGRFEFSGLAPANYTVEATAAGYYTGSGLDEPGNTPTFAPAAVSAQKPAATVTLRLNKAGVITGRLTDADGRPVAKVEVNANRLVYRFGQATLSTMRFSLMRIKGGFAETDDRGEYRLYGLPDGNYYVSADSGSRKEFAKLTYYPGFADTALIQSIAVKDGNQVTADFSLARPAPLGVSGKVLVPAEVRNAKGMTLYLASRNPIVQDNPPIARNASAARSADGAEQQFEVRDVVPGKYELFAVVSAGLLGEQSPTAVARIPFEVRDRSLEGLVGVAELSQTLKGRVVAKAPGLRIDTGSPFVQPLQSMPSVVTARATQLTPVAPDGTFVLEGIYPATYLVGLAGSIPAKAYVSEIRSGNRSIYPAGVVTVDSGPTEPLEFTLSSGTTNVRGTALDEQQQSVTGARVVLVPEPPARHNIRLYRYGTSPQNGAFQFLSVAPGEYKVFAWDAALGQREYATEFLARIETFGQRLTVKPDTPVTGVRVQMIPRQ